VAGGDQERLLYGPNAWAVAQGLPAGEFMLELTDAETGEPPAVLDLAWPNGLHEGPSRPVAVLIEQGEETEEGANDAGYRYFTEAEAFRAYAGARGTPGEPGRPRIKGF
jgi:hypothetical protein